MSDTEVSSDTLDQIDSLLSGDEAEEVIPTDGVDEQIEDPEQALTDAEGDTEDILEEEADEDQDNEGDLDTDGESEIDYDLMVPMSDGRDPMKLGEMKDMVNDIERSKADVDSQRMALINQETELNSYMQQMGIQVPPEFQKHMADQQSNYLQDQHNLMIKMMPELTDKNTFTEMRKNIVQVAASSNFSEEEIAQVSDARIVHLLNRLSVLEAKEKKAQDTVKQIKQKAMPKGRVKRNVGKVSQIDRQVNKAMKSNNRDDKDAAIAALIG